MNHDTFPMSLILHPQRGVTQAVVAGKWKIPLFLALVAFSFSGFAFAMRWNAEPSVLQSMRADGSLSKASEREIVERIQTEERSRMVGEVFSALVGLPFKLLLGAWFLKFWLWLVGESLPFPKVFAAISIALLPLVVFHLIQGVSFLMQLETTEATRNLLVPSHLGVWLSDRPLWTFQLGRAIDFFRFGSVLFLSWGIHGVGTTSLKKSIVVCAVAYFMFVGVLEMGVPGLLGGSP